MVEIIYIIFLVPIVLLAVDDIRNKFKDLNRYSYGKFKSN